MVFFFFSSRRRHTRCSRDWSSDVCSSDLELEKFSDLVRLRDDLSIELATLYNDTNQPEKALAEICVTRSRQVLSQVDWYRCREWLGSWKGHFSAVKVPRTFRDF